MFYYYLFVALGVGAVYVWATKKYGRAAGPTSWRKAINQNWALYRRRLLKRTRSQTPPALSGGDKVPLISSDTTESIHLELRSVTSDGDGEGGLGSAATTPGTADLLPPPPPLLPAMKYSGGGVAANFAISSLGGVRTTRIDHLLIINYHMLWFSHARLKRNIPIRRFIIIILIWGQMGIWDDAENHINCFAPKLLIDNDDRG